MSSIALRQALQVVDTGTETGRIQHAICRDGGLER
jgi:hypothetical protein